MLVPLTRHLLAQPQPLRALLGAVVTIPLASVMAVGSAMSLHSLVEPLLGATIATPAFFFGYCAMGYGTIVAVDRALDAVWPARRR